MGRGIYGCTGCKGTFTRKGNADRHNFNIHGEMAIVYNIKTDKISDKRKTNKKFSSPITEEDVITNNRQISNPYDKGLEGFDFSDPNSELNKNADEEKMFKIFEKISPFIDELDSLLSIYKPHPERIKILSNVISYSLISSNPVLSLKDTIRFYRSTIGIKKTLGFVSMSNNITQDQAKEMLKTIILAAPYSKNKFN
jgi:hypothetical protein